MVEKTEKLVTVARFNEPMMAHWYLSVLEDEEIEGYLDDENLVATNWFYGNVTGGAKLRVREADAEQARAVIGEYRRRAFLQ